MNNVASFIQAETVPMLLLVLLAEAALAPFPALRLPLSFDRLVRGAAQRLEAKLNRTNRSERDRLIRGALVTALFIGLAFIIGHIVHFLWVGAILEGLLVLSTLNMGVPLARAFHRDKASPNTSALTRHALYGFFAPVFWYTLLGLPALLVVATVRALDRQIGRKEAHLLSFGATAAKTDDALQYLPARLMALILVPAALFTPGGRPVAALKGWRAALPPNAGINAPRVCLVARQALGNTGPTDNQRTGILILAAVLLTVAALAGILPLLLA